MNSAAGTSRRKRILFLVNPNAGRRISADDAIRDLDERLGDRLDVIVPPSVSFAEQRAAAKRHITSGVDAVIVRGGDGAVGSAFDLVAETGTPLGILPAGTGNDFARARGIRTGHTSEILVDLLEKVASGVLGTPVDAMRVRVTDSASTTTRWSANSVNIGFDARINQVANQTQHVPGSLRYLYALLKVIPEFSAQPFSVSLDGDEHDFDASLVSIQNGPYIGGGIPLAIDAKTDDAKLDVTVVTSGSKPALVSLFPTLYLRMHKLIKVLHSITAERVSVVVPEGLPVYADGDELVGTAGRDCRVDVEVVPNAVVLLNN